MLRAAIAGAMTAASLAPTSVAGTTDADLVDGIRRELAELRVLVEQQQARIAELESRRVAAAPAE